MSSPQAPRPRDSDWWGVGVAVLSIATRQERLRQTQTQTPREKKVILSAARPLEWQTPLRIQLTTTLDVSTAVVWALNDSRLFVQCVRFLSMSVCFVTPALVVTSKPFSLSLSLSRRRTIMPVLLPPRPCWQPVDKMSLKRKSNDESDDVSSATTHNQPPVMSADWGMTDWGMINIPSLCNILFSLVSSRCCTDSDLFASVTPFCR